MVTMGGKSFDLGLDMRFIFQPLAEIDTSAGAAFAQDWVLGLLANEDVTRCSNARSRPRRRCRIFQPPLAALEQDASRALGCKRFNVIRTSNKKACEQ